MTPTAIFPDLTASNILTEATVWTQEFDSILLVFIGLGIAISLLYTIRNLAR